MTPWRLPWVQALGVLVLLLAGLLISLIGGLGTTPSWFPADQRAAPSSPPATPVLPPLFPREPLADTWQTPLFSPDRAPDAPVRQVKNSPDLVGLRLTGVVIDGTFRRALFRQADGRDVTLLEGGQLANGWRLQHIEAQAVQLELDGQNRRLQLPSPRLPSPAPHTNTEVSPPDSSIILDRLARPLSSPGGH